MSSRETLWCAIAAGLILAAAALPALADPLVERGRYLVKITGCNDCHTANYAPLGGKVPEKAWLTGDALGWRGPWGTTYPINLRLYMQELTEDEWPAPAYVPPDETPAGPYVQFPEPPK